MVSQNVTKKWLLIMVTMKECLNMKIIKQKSEEEVVAITFRLQKNLLVKLAGLAKKHKISRQKLVAEVLEQAMADKSFKLEIKD